MPKTVQIRDLDDDVYAALQRRAAEQGLSVPEFLRREVDRIASRISLGQWLERTGRRTAGGGRVDTVAALDELRGDWPE